MRRPPPKIRLRGKGIEARRSLDRLLGVALHSEAVTAYELRQQHPRRLPILDRLSGFERLCVGLARPLFLDEPGEPRNQRLVVALAQQNSFAADVVLAELAA